LGLQIEAGYNSSLHNHNSPAIGDRELFEFSEDTGGLPVLIQKVWIFWVTSSWGEVYVHVWERHVGPWAPTNEPVILGLNTSFRAFDCFSSCMGQLPMARRVYFLQQWFSNFFIQRPILQPNLT